MKVLSKEQIKSSVSRSGFSPRPPVFMGNWWGKGLPETIDASLLHQLAVQYPDDILGLWYRQPGYDLTTLQNPEYRFGLEDYSKAERHSIGQSAVLLDEWEKLDAFLEHFPDPNEPGNFDLVYPIAEQGRKENRYMLGCWWAFFHEFFWGIRGMENLMVDYYDHMEELKILGKRVAEYYKVIISRYAEIGCSGIFTSDDLGHQHGPMFSPAIFRELYLPLYTDVIHYAHSLGLQFFLHSCGDNSLFMDMLIEAGVDVLHPIQKGCMDLKKTVEEYGNRISFLVGIDVQDLLVHASEEEVRREICSIRNLFNKRRGGLLLGMGNGILPGASYENIRIAKEEMCRLKFNN